MSSTLPTWTKWGIRLGVVAGSLWIASQLAPGTIKPFAIFLVLATLFVYMRRYQGMPPLFKLAAR